MAYEEAKRIEMDNIAAIEQKIDDAIAKGKAEGEYTKALEIAKNVSSGL